MTEVIYTPAQSIQVINKVKDSKFYGSISRANNEEEIKKFIDRIKDRYHDATHNVSAFILGTGDQALKHFDDDGEPAGSSGPPVLQAIEGAALCNTVIVVTRYFGGTKLGIGGLIRAYGDTARMVITEAGIKKMKLYFQAAVSGNYHHLGTIMGQIASYKGDIIATDYNNEGCVVSIIITPEDYQGLEESLLEKTGANVVFQVKKHLFK